MTRQRKLRTAKEVLNEMEQEVDSIEAIKARLHEKLRAENLSLCCDGHSDIYYSGERDGKIEAYSYMLWELDPSYDLAKDFPFGCITPGCRKFFFPKRNNPLQKYHSRDCRDLHYQKMRSEKNGIFAADRDMNKEREWHIRGNWQSLREKDKQN